MEITSRHVCVCLFRVVRNKYVRIVLVSFVCVAFVYLFSRTSGLPTTYVRYETVVEPSRTAEIATKVRVTIGRHPRALIVYGSEGYKPSLYIKKFLEAQRIEFHQVNALKGMYLVKGSKNVKWKRNAITLDKLAVLFVIASTQDYRSKVMQPYLEYCRSFHIPLIWVALAPKLLSMTPGYQLENVRGSTLRSSSIQSVGLSQTYPFFYARAGASMAHKSASSMHWTGFSVENSNLNSEPATKSDHDLESTSHPGEMEGRTVVNETVHYRTLVEASVTSVENGQTVSPVVIEDLGHFDGVRKVFWGMPLSLWLTQLVLLDAVYSLCKGTDLLRLRKERWVLVDIDDIFLAPDGRRMTVDDVQVPV